MGSISSFRKTAEFFLVYVALVLPLCFLGYGSDNDTYGVLDSGRSTWHYGHLMTSRYPGYWLYEALVYAVGHLGGSIATNIASMCVGAFILWRFIVLCRKIGIQHEYLLAFCVLFVPTFLIAASSTMDYLWSIAFLVVAVELLLDSRLALATVAGAVAIGFRASNSLVLAGVYAGLLVYGFKVGWKLRQIAWVAISGVGSAVLGLLFFLPSWVLAHHTMSFLIPGVGPSAMWTLKMHIGRFIYKTIYLFGPFATCIILFLAIRNRAALRIISNNNAEFQKGFFICFGAFAGGIVLFAKFPMEVSYLLPGMVFFVLIIGMTLFHSSRKSILAVLCGIILFNFFSVSFAKPNIPFHATNAKLTFSPESGVLVEDIKIRRKAMKCETNDCWVKEVGQ
jgi:hypothetical protein